jgi:hypothetical protein
MGIAVIELRARKLARLAVEEVAWSVIGHHSLGGYWYAPPMIPSGL